MSYDDPAYRAVCRSVADDLFEIARKAEINVAMDALGMAMVRVLLESKPKTGRTHRQVWENYLEHVQSSGESALQLLGFGTEGKPDNAGT